jgi:hypothetical protein
MSDRYNLYCTATAALLLDSCKVQPYRYPLVSSSDASEASATVICLLAEGCHLARAYACTVNMHHTLAALLHQCTCCLELTHGCILHQFSG